MRMEKSKCKVWSKEATQLLREWTVDCNDMIFRLTEPLEGTHCFGQLILSCQNNKPVCAAEELCDMNEAIESADYLNRKFNLVCLEFYEVVY